MQFVGVFENYELANNKWFSMEKFHLDIFYLSLTIWLKYLWDVSSRGLLRGIN